MKFENLFITKDFQDLEDERKAKVGDLVTFTYISKSYYSHAYIVANL